MEISINGMLLNVVEILAILGLTYGAILTYLATRKES